MNSKTIAMTAATAAISLTTLACNNASTILSSYDSATLDLSSEEQTMCVKTNDFAWRMFGEVCSAAEGQNTVVSPLSVVYALGMVNNGASGETATEISTTLGFDGNTDALNSYCHKLMNVFPSLDKATRFDVANCVLVNKNYTLQNDFKKTVQKQYSALVESRDFADGKLTTHINEWCNKHTQGMIPKMLDNTDPDAIAYIMNALYFKGPWAKKFDKGITHKANFYKADGTKQLTDMMRQTDDFGYAVNDTFATLSMDYGNGAYSMQVLLPNNGKTIANVVEAMKSQSWHNFIGSINKREVNVVMPKFTIEQSTTLNDILTKLGIQKMFSAGEANFSRFCDRPSYVSKVLQKAKIEVDEEGTKAAAVTVVEMELTSMLQEEITPSFIANRPFIFVITENSTATVCFIGQYTGE